jgi:hypothetical protein
MGALSRPEEVVALVKLRLAAGRIKRQIPPEEHWAFCYSMLQKVSRSFALVIQQLGPQLRNAVSTAAPFPPPALVRPPLLESRAAWILSAPRRICLLFPPLPRGLALRWIGVGFRVVSDGRCCDRRCASSTSCSAPSTPLVSLLNLLLIGV